MSQASGLTLSICLRCRDGREEKDTDLDQRGGRRLAQSIAAEFDQSQAAHLGVQLRGVNCMSQCKRPCTMALSGPGRFTYLFGDLDPLANRQDVLSVAATYATSEDGFLARADRPPVLRGGILGRIPPVGFTGEFVETPISLAPQKADSEKAG